MECLTKEEFYNLKPGDKIFFSRELLESSSPGSPHPWAEPHWDRIFTVRLAPRRGLLEAVHCTEMIGPDDILCRLWICFPASPGRSRSCVGLQKGVDLCPDCGIRGQWINCAMKCPSCWKTW